MVLVYFLSFFIQSNFTFFQALAQEKSAPRVNIVAILVDDKIYGSISSWLQWYATQYVQNKLSDTKALVMPLNLDNIDSYDIYRIMENIYFDWLKDVNSQLIWLVMVWDIPLPVVNQDWYVFPTVYPYTDFENQKYIWDERSRYFIPNWNSNWQSDIRHWLINYWSDTWAYLDFFEKIKKYDDNSDAFIWDSLRYEDFVAEKEWFLTENYQYYKNKVMFGEDLWYQRYSPLMKKIFASWSTSNGLDLLMDLKNSWAEITWMTDDAIENLKNLSSQTASSTKMLQQEIKDGYLADYNKLFSNSSLSTKRDNIFAWWRWIKTYENSSGEKNQIIDADSSSSMIQLKDTLYLWNDNLEWVIQNLNGLMEDMIDKKIEDEKYSMDIVIPVDYKKVTWKRARFSCYWLVTRRENFYFWKSARYIDDPIELSIYRWTYRNLMDVDGITYESLSWWNNPSKSDYDSTDLSLKSVWSSYDIFSNQAEWNRWYVMTRVSSDLELRTDKKTRGENRTEHVKGSVYRRYWPEGDCWDWDECEDMDKFASRWRWWASPINLDTDNISEWRYELKGYKATDSWRSIFDMWWFQSLLQWEDEGDLWEWWISWTWVWPQSSADSYKAYEKYSRPTQVEWRDRIFWKRYRIYENHIPDRHIDFSVMNYWQLPQSIINNWKFGKESDKMFSINSNSKRGGLLGLGCKSSEKYTYKFLSSVVEHKSTTDDEINGIDYFKYWENGSLWRYYSDLIDAYSWLYRDIERLSLSWNELKLSIQLNETKLKNILSWLNAQLSMEEVSVEEIENLLNDIQSIISWNKANILELYSLAWSLYSDEISSALEYMINMEGWNVGDYIDSSSATLKISFLPARMDEINKIHGSLPKEKDKILQNYSDSYYSILSQSGLFSSFFNQNENRLTEELKWKINDVHNEFENVFTFTFPQETDGVGWSIDWEWGYDSSEDRAVVAKVENSITLTWGTVFVIMNEFLTGLDFVKNIYSNLIEEDKVWPAIVAAARTDPDFIRWQLKKWTYSRSFSDVDIIQQYAEWAKWDGYNSDGAKKNHELLKWVVEHMSWMNILTPDRPIDSPRYVSMQSIAENEIRFIYPNLFKVEVFKSVWKTEDWNDMHELMTRWEIKESLVKYLYSKVDEYNSILKNEYDKASSDNIYFQQLSNFNQLATPTTDKSVRPYNYFEYEDFVDAIWWEDMLDAIADMLYYQNLTNKTKLSSENIWEDIWLISDSFDLNEKRLSVLEDYLEEWKEKIKNPLLVIPTYQMSGYEVAYINSDGWDYIVASNSLPDFISDSSYSTQVSNDIKEIQQDTKLWWEISDECGIPDNGVLPLFKISWFKVLNSPWYEWFKCRLKHTKEEPFKIKLSFDSALWEILTSTWIKEFIKEKAEEPFVDRWDSMDQYLDKWEAIADPWTGYDATKIITDLWVKAELHNKEVVDNNPIGKILKENIKITNSNWILSDNNPSSLLEISSVSNIGNVTVVFMWTWDGCIQLSGNDNSIDTICPNTSVKKIFNPKTNPYKWEIISADHKAWSDGLDIKVYLWGGYIENVIRYEVSPSAIENAEIIFWDEKTVAWMRTLVEVIWYDKYGNHVSWTEDKYDFIVSEWKFLKDWAYKTWFRTNDFRNLRFYYIAPENTDSSKIVMQIKKAQDLFDANEEYLATQEQKIIQASPIVELDKTVILWYGQTETNVSHTLWSEALRRLDIYIQDKKWEIVDVDSQILATSQQWLVVIWELRDGGNVWAWWFFETSMSYVSWGMATIYFYPTNVAWDDVINIEIPWMETRKINIKIKPWGEAKAQVVVEKNVLELWDTMWIEIFYYDRWWNLIEYLPEEWLSYDDKKIEIIWLTSKPWYRHYTVKWIWAWATYGACSDSYALFTVDKHLMPTSWLNIMYLNYFWDDRWNQWWYFSKNNQYIESVMKKSNKIIATTTQLIAENKIKKMWWKISPWFVVWNPWNVKTNIIIDGWKLNMSIWDISNAIFDLSMPIATQITQSNRGTLSNIMSNPNISSNSYIFYVPNKDDYSIKNGSLYRWDEEVTKINKDVVLQLSNSFVENWDNIWNLVYKWENYGSIVFHLPSFVARVDNFETPWDRYKIAYTFTDGSTSRLNSVGIFDIQSDFELETWYKSIQNSKELDEKIWFMWDFKNITLFGEWEIVGEATRKFWSELLINLWDPVLSRKSNNEDVYGTDFDGWIWQEIYSDPENDIFRTHIIDFNNDGVDDLLAVYLDGSVKISKGYGGNPDLRDMQELMRMAVNVKDVYVWDVDGNGYSDIIVYTQNDQIRTYLNYYWVFDVDGNVACLNTNVHEWVISSTPTDLSEIFQIFVEDMDLDGKVDIVTYDNKWYIKIFYWWSTNGYANYLSMDKYSCDDNWYEREKPNTLDVQALWVQVTSERIFDNSMLYRVGIWREENKQIEQEELEQYGIPVDPKWLKGEIESWTDPESLLEDALTDIPQNFDTEAASKKFIEEWAKFLNVKLYENHLVWWSDDGNYIFSPLSFLDPLDPEDVWSAWKVYSVKSWWAILSEWDIVTVTVTVKASDSHNFNGAFWDIIQWPWKVYYNDENMFEWIKFLNNQRWAVQKQKDGKFSYIIDNITLWAWESMSFQYDLEYTGIPLKEISISHKSFRSDDEYPDIKIQSNDGCEKDFNVSINGWWRSFKNQTIPLQSMIDELYKEAEEETKDYADSVIDAWWDINSLPWLVWDSINRLKLLNKWSISNDESWKVKLKDALLREVENWFGWNVDLNVELSIFEEQMEEIDDIVDDIMQWMCNGYSFGWSNNCEWLPVPFNQAFLAPGKYHLFGCWELPMWKLEWWLPVFFFPGNLATPVGVLPIPNAQKWVRDGFVWIPWWTTWNSWIRIYAAPTLTAQLWIAVCMWPYMDEKIFPSPLSDVAGNCVVFAVKPQCKNGWTKWEKSDPENPNETFDLILEDVRDSGTCMQSQKWPQVIEKWYRSSPFNLYSYRGTERDSWNRGDFDWKETTRIINFKNMDVNGWNNNQVEYSTSFMWIVELETNAYIWADEEYVEKENSIVIWDVDILWGDYSVNKIRWWIQQWVRSILIDKWLDPQIRYILNQLTKMHVNVKVPDVVNLIWNEIDNISNISTSISENYRKYASSVSWYFEDFKNFGLSEVKSEQTSKWNWISQEIFNKANSDIANPFEGLASMMNQSNIINIYTEPLTVKLPIIFSEDINAYEIYLKQRVSENEKILAQREWILNSLWWKCAAKNPESEKKQCLADAEKYLSSFIEFKQNDWSKMMNQVYANIMVLQKYRNFPFEIYERIHVIDRYMSEIASLINNTIWYISYRTTVNAERFVGYVDAIVLMFNIIKTYQLIIDFSDERSRNCGNCARDTYDQYSCKLSLLCNWIQLPIIQIPNFKLPNITIDLTDIDLWIDIVLPEFNFQWVKVELPELPNLPEPPSIWADIKLLELPNIPIMPEPPKLPELPSFIPEVDIELPVLPPAPELPKLPSSIEWIIKVAKTIWRIYCIVKGDFWMVWESSVKAKIEQLTQRTYKVDWIDDIMDFTNWTAAPIKNYGVDYEISSHLNFQFDISAIHDYLDVLTKWINNLTTSSVRWVNNKADNLYDETINPLTDVSNKIDNLNIDVNATLLDFDRSDGDSWIIKTSMLGPVEKWLVTDEIEYVDYSDARDRLNEVLSYFKMETNDTTFINKFSPSLSKIENQINSSNEIESNEEWMKKMQGDVNDYLQSKMWEYNNIAYMINEDYDGFLAMVTSQQDDNEWTKSEINSWKMLTFWTDLFNISSTTRENLDKISKYDSYEVLIDNKQSIVDGYRNAINTNTAQDLWLSDSQYLVLRDNIWKMRNQISWLYYAVKNTHSTNMVSKNWNAQESKSLLAASVSSGVPKETFLAVDPSSYAKWIYEKIIKWIDAWKRLAKVVYSDMFSSLVWDNYFKTNHSDEHDIILWTDNWVYKKCFKQKCESWWSHYRWYYVHNISKVLYEETWISFDSNTKLKIADEKEEVKNREVWSQNYDTFAFHRDVTDVDAYLIKLVDRVDSSYEKQDQNANYVLVLPDEINIEDLYDKKTRIKIGNRDHLLKDLVWTVIIEVVHYDSHKASATVVISEIDRRWYYSCISTLKYEENKNLYEVNSPWSNQIVAWKQIVWDDQHPLGEANLFRPSVQEVVSEWNDLEWYVWTNYILNINWRDNVALSYINISQDGKILAEKYTSKIEDVISLEWLFNTKNEKHLYKTMWIDQFGNKTEKEISVSYFIPEIKVVDIKKDETNEEVSIVAELSQDIDQWNVSFQRRKDDEWKTMKRKCDNCCPDMSLSPKMTTVIWSPYNAWKSIAMYDSNDAVVAILDPDTAEIVLQSWYVDTYDIKATVEDTLTLNVCNKSSKKDTFSVALPIDEIIKIEADGYTLADLPKNWWMWMYNGWKVLYKDGINVLMISPTGHLYSEFWLEWLYEYDKWTKTLIVTLYQRSDVAKKYPIKIRIKAEPLVQ